MSYDNPWLFNDQIVNSEDIEDYEGFVYLITNLVSGRKYIGKKTFWFRRKANKKAKRRTTVESDWKSYYGSCEPLLEDLKQLGHEHFKREILYLCKHKKSMGYYEIQEQFLRDVLETNEYYNTNIAGKWFSNERQGIFEIVHRNKNACAKQSESTTGKLNYRYMGDYITPWGVFPSSVKAKEACPKPFSCQRVIDCCKNNETVITREIVKNSYYFTIGDIGLSYKDLGFSFIEKVNIKD